MARARAIGTVCRSRPPTTNCHGGTTPVSWPPPTPASWHPDTGVGARTTTEPSLDPSQLRETAASGKVVVDNSILIFPAKLAQSQRTAPHSRLVVLPQHTA